MKLAFSWQIFEKHSNTNFIKIRPVGTELFNTEGRKDVTNLSLFFQNSANAPKLEHK